MQAYLIPYSAAVSPHRPILPFQIRGFHNISAHTGARSGLVASSVHCRSTSHGPHPTILCDRTAGRYVRIDHRIRRPRDKSYTAPILQSTKTKKNTRNTPGQIRRYPFCFSSLPSTLLIAKITSAWSIISRNYTMPRKVRVVPRRWSGAIRPQGSTGRAMPD